MGQGLILTSPIHFLIMVLSGFSQDVDEKNPRLYAVLTLVMLNKLPHQFLAVIKPIRLLDPGC